MDNYQKNTEDMQDGAITLLDVLGWKGIWQRKSNALQALMDLIDTAQKKSSLVVKDYEGFKDLEINVESISDTIAITTYGDKLKSLVFHAGITGRLIADSIISEIPVRGATSYEKLTKNGNVMVGPAVDEVASWYECSDMIGVFQTPSAFLTRIEKGYYKHFLFDYNVTIKQHGKMETRCSDWLGTWRARKLTIEDLTDKLMKMGPITPAIYSKFKNTIDFYEEAYKQKGYEFDSVMNDKMK